MTDKPRIGIIGIGMMGSAIAGCSLDTGHRVTLRSRDAAKRVPVVLRPDVAMPLTGLLAELHRPTVAVGIGAEDGAAHVKLFESGRSGRRDQTGAQA